MASNKDQNEEENDKLNDDSDDSFGLPKIEYQPIRREEEKTEPEPEPEPELEPEPEPTSSWQVSEPEPEPSIESLSDQEQEQPVEQQPTYSYKAYEEESSIWPKLLGILLIIVLALAAIWFFVVYKPKQDAAAEKARVEAEQRAATDRAKQEEENRLRLQREAAERRRLDSLEAVRNPPAGSIETLGGRTGKYYVVAASAVDLDLLMDYAKKLSADGVSSKIVPPYGKVKVSRIVIAEGDTWAETQAKADDLKATYGNSLWVLKY